MSNKDGLLLENTLEQTTVSNWQENPTHVYSEVKPHVFNRAGFQLSMHILSLRASPLELKRCYFSINMLRIIANPKHAYLGMQWGFTSKQACIGSGCPLNSAHVTLGSASVFLAI